MEVDTDELSGDNPETTFTAGKKTLSIKIRLQYLDTDASESLKTDDKVKQISLIIHVLLVSDKKMCHVDLVLQTQNICHLFNFIIPYNFSYFFCKICLVTF